MDGKGKVAIVTGSATGVGAEVARQLAARGCNVVINYTKSEAEAKEAEAACKALGVETLMVQADVSVDADCRRMAQAALDKWGRIDVLVNNAAIFATVPMSRAPFDEIAVDEWDRMMGVNLKGTWLASCAVIPVMRSQGYGKIINISSGTALKGSPSRIHYVSSKAAILGFTKTLANEVGRDNICVNCVAPGSTLSEENPDDGIVKMRTAATATRALKRVQTPEDLTGAIVFFASADSDFITGQTLVVDGGSCLH